MRSRHLFPPAPNLVMCLVVAALCVPTACARQLVDRALPPGTSEIEIAVPTTDTLTLPGTLTLPASSAGPLKHRPPIVVLGQGSGVQDRDGTVGANKFLQQLAWGLAERGIASIRYDRRAMVYPQNFYGHADLDHEIVIDASSALEFAAQEPRVDGHAVFFAGHSLAAQVGPDVVARRLAEQPGSVRGLILMSGVARPLDVVIREQIETLGRRQGATEEQLAATLEAWDDTWREARDPKVLPAERIGPGDGMPASYWRDWLARDPVKTLHTLHLPVLVTRGSKDVNATHADFERLEAAAAAPGSAAKEFEGLNHLYMPLAGEANGMDVMQPGQVSPVFLDYVAAWIHRTAGE
jgi:pimeloyl-ACP methyl ester carboxylesterase